MFKILSLIICLAFLTNNIEAKEYDLKEVLHKSLLFYEAQRSGKLPADNRIKWRGDSMLDDGKNVGHDLTGGYFDAGDLVKFGFPMAYTMTVLSWGAIDFADAYTKAGELENVHKAIKWGTDYFIKCHTSETEFYGQLGNGEEDHAYWGRPEDWPKNKTRPAYKVTSAHGGSDLVGETAAAMAAASIVFKKENPSYSQILLKEAKSLYDFADKHRAVYTTEIVDAVSFYKSWSGYGDELAWAAAWLFRATGDKHYKSEVEKHFKEFSKQLTGNPPFFGWDEKTAGVQTLMADLTGEDKYKVLARNFCDTILHAPRTSKGMVYLDQWGTLRHAADVSFICLQTARIGINSTEYRKFAESQIGYILGDTGRSFVVGFGVNPPSHEHHRASSCPDRPAVCDYNSAFNNPGPNPQTLTGALVGGPDKDDVYVDKRDDYVRNEVACDYNAAFQGSIAALLHFNN